MAIRLVRFLVTFAFLTRFLLHQSILLPLRAGETTMKRAIIVCLTILSLVVFDSTAEAGRRRDRRAARKSGGAVYAGAYQRNSGGGGYSPVANVNYIEPQAAATTTVATSERDLTVADISVEDNVLCVTVKNIGLTATPETRLEIAITSPNTAEIAVQNVRVLPLLPNQAVKIRFAGVPAAGSEVEVLVDPDRTLTEISKENNAFRVRLVDTAIAEEPPMLTDETNLAQPGG
jgi:hypothetical protein